MLVLSEKEYYDFKLTADILIKSQGVAGIVFRMRDEFNYYAFIIDKSLGYKAIVKVVNNKVTILKQIQDGGILINTWHTVQITNNSGLISVYIYNKENAKKSETEKRFEVEDYTFNKGTAGFLVNGVSGFFFDDFEITAEKCFSPWQPNPNMEIHNINTNIYVENFTGNIVEKYTIIDIEESYNREGPSNWQIISDEITNTVIRQSSLVYDISSSRRPSMAIINFVYFQNGFFKVIYNPSEKLGMVSIILKYEREEDENLTTKEEFYTFDIVNEESESYYMFRKWNNGGVQIIKRFEIDQKESINLFKMNLTKAYLVKEDNWVIVEFINQKVTIKISQNGIDYATIFNLFDESIRAGAVGFGTFKTRCDFRSIYVEAPKVMLTQKDIDYIMVNTIDDIPMPNVIDIYKSGIVSSCSRTKNFSSITAMGTVLAYSTILGSSLGNDYCGSSSSSSSSSTKIINSTSVHHFSEEVSWKVCVNTRSHNQRQDYCIDKFDSEIMKMRCEVIKYK